MPIVISQREHRESYQLFFPNSEILVETDQDAALDLVMKHNFFSFSSKNIIKKYSKLYDIRPLNFKNTVYHSFGVLHKTNCVFNMAEKDLINEFFHLSV